MAPFGGLMTLGYWAIATKSTAVVHFRESALADPDTEFAAFFGRVWEVAMAATQSAVGTDEASDIASAVTIRLWRHRDRYPELAKSRADLDRFVVVSARRMLLNQERNRRLRATRELGYTTERTDGTAIGDASTALSTAEMHGLVDKVIDALPDRTREAWRLVQLEGRTHADAASVMGIAKQTVNVQLCRALSALREAFDRYQRDGLLPPPPSPSGARRRTSTEPGR